MEKKRQWGLITFIIVILALSYVFAGILSLFVTTQEQGNVAIIRIWGPITLGSSQGLFSENVASSQEIVRLIEKANKNNMIKAIIFDINSPGGSPVASDEIALAIKNTNKTTISLIREVGASGAYWVASSTDHIIANRMSITGSIGAYTSYLEFAGLIEDYNVTYRVIKSGKYKDTGSPFKEMTHEEAHLIQQRIDSIHEFFIEEIANNRNLSYEHVKKIADGMFHLGTEGKEIGLIDELGSMNEAIQFIENKKQIKVNVVEYKIKRGFMDSLFGILNFQKFSIGETNQPIIRT